MNEDWEVVKSLDIGAHRLELIALTVDELVHYEIVVDCVVQCVGPLKECEGKWRSWVRALNKIARERKEGAKA